MATRDVLPSAKCLAPLVLSVSSLLSHQISTLSRWTSMVKYAVPNCTTSASLPVRKLALRREELSLQSKEIAFLGIGCPCFIQSISFKGIKQEKNLFFLLLFYFIQVFSLCSRESFTLRPVTVGSQVTNLQGAWALHIIWLDIAIRVATRWLVNSSTDSMSETCES